MAINPKALWPLKAAAVAEDGDRGSRGPERLFGVGSASTAPESASGEAPRSLEGNLLDARSRMGRSIIEIVEADFIAHGPEVIAALRTKNPAAYARLISDLVHFKGLLNSERVTPKRKPREIRAKDLLKAIDEAPVDVNCPTLPAKHRDRWLKAMEALQPRTPWNLTPDELRAVWDADLAEWFETSWRNRVGRHRQSLKRRKYFIYLWELTPGIKTRVRIYMPVRKPKACRGGRDTKRARRRPQRNLDMRTK